MKTEQIPAAIEFKRRFPDTWDSFSDEQEKHVVFAMNGWRAEEQHPTLSHGEVKEIWNEYKSFLEAKYPPEDGKKFEFTCDIHRRLDAAICQLAPKRVSEIKVGEILDVLDENIHYYKGADGDHHIDMFKLAHAVNDYYKSLTPEPKEPSQWISVSDRLPVKITSTGYSDTVFLWCDNKYCPGIRWGKYNHETKGWIPDNDDHKQLFKKLNFTHWSPLLIPPAPEQEPRDIFHLFDGNINDIKIDGETYLLRIDDKRSVLHHEWITGIWHEKFGHFGLNPPLPKTDRCINIEKLCGLSDAPEQEEGGEG